MSASVTDLPTGYTPGVALVDAAELARLREVERLAALLCTEIYDRRARRWYRAPMAFVAPLAAALLEGTDELMKSDDQQCACVEPSCRCTMTIPNDGETLCRYCRTFEHEEG